MKNTTIFKIEEHLKENPNSTAKSVLKRKMDTLDINTNGEIICIADIGKRKGIARYGNNVKDIFKAHTFGGDFEVYYDRYNVKATEKLNSGTNNYILRELKGNTADKREHNYKKLLKAVLENRISNEMITMYTISIRKYVSDKTIEHCA